MFFSPCVRFHAYHPTNPKAPRKNMNMRIMRSRLRSDGPPVGIGGGVMDGVPPTFGMNGFSPLTGMTIVSWGVTLVATGSGAGAGGAIGGGADGGSDG